eukprot:6196241-Prymnesium_polylepis.1
MAIRAFVLCLLQLASATTASSPRLRREIRSWTSLDLERLRDALYIMGNTTLTAGRAKYGRSFLTHARISILHAVAVLDPRGDQGHSNWAVDRPQQCFFTFHNALLMAIENSVRGITRVAFGSALEGLPYWDASLDAPGGPYHGDSGRSVYTFIGQSTGNPAQRYAVVGGLMPNAEVPRYPTNESDPLDYDELGAAARAIFPRSAAGWTRQHAVKQATWSVQRFPALHAREALIPHDEVNPWRNLSAVMAHFPAGFAALNETDVLLTPAMALTCRGTAELAAARRDAGQLSIDAYLACMDAGTFDLPDASRPCPAGQEASAGASRQWQAARCQQLWMHSQAHFKIGSQSVLGLPVTAEGWLNSWPSDGDFMDLATSPNDLLVFVLWHADSTPRALRCEPT